jgi:hypothetical protein
MLGTRECSLEVTNAAAKHSLETDLKVKDQLNFGSTSYELCVLFIYFGSRHRLVAEMLPTQSWGLKALHSLVGLAGTFEVLGRRDGGEQRKDF